MQLWARQGADLRSCASEARAFLRCCCFLSAFCTSVQCSVCLDPVQSPAFIADACPTFQIRLLTPQTTDGFFRHSASGTPNGQRGRALATPRSGKRRSSDKEQVKGLAGTRGGTPRCMAAPRPCSATYSRRAAAGVPTLKSLLRAMQPVDAELPLIDTPRHARGSWRTLREGDSPTH